ncbi:GPH family glycoside/pentoside/hexuronide:cation symporter [Sphingomonas jinjuensis]|uniref:GPH family glycoside/pentoside/hexuronide:cation symporter n=1 Tax=Sphingomonas jinjuensis TaxID=535907 RepID=A0A840F6M6_9SPHN|nr:MFS transporter [Sphingomonas jinjuensis]MBB4153560.1 GPH family glycoside/pentoside/hexuronide:cation symporter [Sphingomonas jinjuensis]
MIEERGEGRVGRWRLIGFASGDFAFNLYWQSAMLYLLFYYTDALGLGMEAAAAMYLVASCWDGAVSFAVGVLVDRYWPRQAMRRALVLGAVPLGLSFALAYAPPPVGGTAGAAIVLAGHLLFRTAYALVNIPYLALSGRVSGDSRDRSFVAGIRMLAGTAAAVLVALGTVPLGSALMGVRGGPQAFLGAAMLFAGIGSVILILVGWTFRDALVADDDDAQTAPFSVLASLAATAGNRAFVTLAAAMMAMIVAVSVLDKSVLYYFKYALGDEAAGHLALAAMMAVSAVAVPMWMGIARVIGVRRLWFVASGLCGIGLTVFALADLPRTGAMQLFLVTMQAGTVALHFAFWSMLPDAIDWGRRAHGMRADGVAFGLVALLQRLAIGVATAMLGLSLGQSGYVANSAQSPETLTALRVTIALVPLGFFMLAAVMMALNPLGRRAG